MKMSRLLWKACDAVWAGQLGEQEEGRRVGVVGRVSLAQEVMMLKAVVKPWLCGCCATRRGDVVQIGCWMLRRERCRCDWSKRAVEDGKIRLHVKGPSSCLSSLN